MAWQLGGRVRVDRVVKGGQEMEAMMGREDVEGNAGDTEGESDGCHGTGQEGRPLVHGNVIATTLFLFVRKNGVVGDSDWLTRYGS